MPDEEIFIGRRRVRVISSGIQEVDCILKTVSKNTGPFRSANVLCLLYFLCNLWLEVLDRRLGYELTLISIKISLR